MDTNKKGKKIGKITHFFDKIGVAVIELESGLKVGDMIMISGHGMDFEQPVDSMQMEHQQVTAAKAGDAIGMKMVSPVKAGCEVFLLKQ
jgi:putative protease